MKCFAEDAAFPFRNRRADFVFAGVLLVSALALILGCVLFSRSHSLEALFVYLLCGAFVLVLECLTWCTFIATPRETPFGMTGVLLLSKLLGVSLMCSIVLEGITLFGAVTMTPLSIADWNVLRIGFFFVLSYASLLFVTVCSRQKPFEALRSLWNRLDHRFLVRAGIALVISAVLSGALALALEQFKSLSFASTFMLSFSVIACIALFVCLRQRAGARPEWLFLVAALLLGSYLALFPPAVTNVSWDDQIHFKRSLALSYIVNSEYSDADATLLNPLIADEDFPRPTVGDDWMPDGDTWSQSNIDAYRSLINRAHETAPYHITDGFNTAPSETSMATYTSVGYVPSAVGLWLGRALHLPFDVTFTLGRWMNLLAYCIVSFVAIRIIPVKKILLCAVALLPTNLFMASYYSYDPWLISFLFVAIALVVREICTPDKKLSTKTWLTVFLVFFVALGPKAIYFPLIGLLFLLPKSKFESAKQRRLFIGSVVLLGCIVVATFLLPFVASGAGDSSDMRGGSDVSAPGQVAFILADPLRYVGILINFFVNQYLAIGMSCEYTLSFAYFGNLGMVYPWLCTFPVIFLLFVAVSDAGEHSWLLCKAPIIAWMALLFILTVGLVASSLYVSFTPVGLDTVKGCQPRYLLPLIFPLLALCFNFRLQNRIRSDRYNLACISLSCVPMVLCCWFLVASKVFV